jgi:hypothetical protein
MPKPIAAHPPYAKRQPPPGYHASYFAQEFGNVQRALLVATVRSVTADTTVSATDDTVLADATSDPISVTLPAADQVLGLKVTIKRMNSGANAVTIVGTVDGTASPTLAAQYDAMTVQSTGSAWILLGSV